MSTSSSPTPWPVKTQLLLAFGVLVALFVTIAACAFVLLQRSDADMKRVFERLFPQTQRLGAVDLMMVRASLEARHAMLVRTPEERQRTLAKIPVLKAEIDSRLAEFEKNISTDEGRRRFEAIRRTQEVFWREANGLVPQIERGEMDAALTTLVDRVVPARDEALKALDHQLAWQSELVAKVSASAVHRGEWVEMLLILSVLAALLIGGGVALTMSRRLERTLGGEPHEAIAAVQAIAAGDLATPVRARVAGDSVMGALSQMQASLTQLVQNVRHSVESVSNASHEIAAGNSDLSVRTEEQASGVQQAASAMVQMTESVRMNADSARQAAQLTGSATEAAGQGGEVVRQVVSTMERIQESSKRIADITATIDGIAFQTNILALNAAVEAARAGDQGRGFAVVAAEVRTLAQRSAAAAREVRHLIDESRSSVDAGSALVEQAGQGMGEIIDRVQKIDALIGQIAEASDEQARGIGDVGSTVQRLDATTQQNAALVEQSAAAAESLRRQAELLQASVRVFRTSGLEPVAA